MKNNCEREDINRKYSSFGASSQETFFRDLTDLKTMAKLLGISIGTLNKWKSTGILPYIRLGGKIYFVKTRGYKSNIKK